MKALILGMDGYLGWSLTCQLVAKGCEVFGIDNGLRRELVEEGGSISAIPIYNLNDRIDMLNADFLSNAGYVPLDIADHDNSALKEIIDFFQPDVIYHLAQIPSAPYSMKDRSRCLFTHKNNLFGTLNLLYAAKEACPNAHIIKIGTMGEYGTPDIPIPEGNCNITIDGRTASLPFPRSAGSWYHQTKVHDTHNIRMACNLWGLTCTDVMQGIVYGTRVRAMLSNPILRTRLDFDECFGTIINRFVVQAIIGHPLTVYGSGEQIRSILPLQDSINCLTLISQNPPDKGGYREINQFHEYMSLNEMATIVSIAYEELTGKTAYIEHYQNPRIEKEDNFYKPKCGKLKKMGYENSDCIQKVVRCMLIDAFENRHVLREYKSVIMPIVRWSGDTRMVEKQLRN